MSLVSEEDHVSRYTEGVPMNSLFQQRLSRKALSYGLIISAHGKLSRDFGDICFY